jgi:protein-S-isoprenylcysteine O-methyltransferase Ste14
MNALWLLLKNLLFTLLVPGFVAGWVPLRFFERRARWPESWSELHFTGAALCLLGLALYLHCQWLLAVRGRGTPTPLDPPKKLVHRGAYQWVRNPMYLAVFTAVAGEAVFLRSWHIAVYLTCLVCAVHVYVLLLEEEALRRRFGALYEDYRREVPAGSPAGPGPRCKPCPHSPPPDPDRLGSCGPPGFPLCCEFRHGRLPQPEPRANRPRRH